jgi:DNA-binding NarL/FixJ family response regulator
MDPLASVMAHAQKSVLVIEDHHIVRSGIRYLLAESDEFAIIAEATSGEAGYRLVCDNQVDIVLLDLSLPGISGIETLRRIRARAASPAVLILSHHQSPQIIRHALEVGANGYVSKFAAGETVVCALRSVVRGQRYIEPDLAAQVLLSTHRPSNSADRLSCREIEILRLYAEGHAPKNIASILHLSNKTIFNNLSAIRGKLGVQTDAALVRAASHIGLTIA